MLLLVVLAGDGLLVRALFRSIWFNLKDEYVMNIMRCVRILPLLEVVNADVLW